MGRNIRKRRSPLAVKVTAATAAIALGGGGLLWAQMNASAHESNNSAQNYTKAAAATVATISCPDVGQKLTSVPAKAKMGVARELANLDKQITEAYSRLASTRQAQANDANFVQNAIVGPLKEKRAATIDRIRLDITRVGGQFNSSLAQLAACTTQTANQTTAGRGGGRNNGGKGNNNGQNNGGQNNNNGGQNNGGNGQATAAPSASASTPVDVGIGGQAGNGPTAADFVDITKVAANVQGKPQNGQQASTGTFTTRCGVNANKNHNTDNVIVAPGVTNGAHHLHDYVGNQKVDAFANNNTLIADQTTCQNQSDLSAYYWPVVREQDGSQDFDQNAAGGGTEGNVGKILTPVQAQIKYVGSPASKVTAMPQFLRIITGDAKTTTNGLANANAHWSCTGFENKVQLTEQYPICPQGSQVVRTFAFQSCWDGTNIDSANHRTHVAFADPASGVCPNGFKAIPQLTMRLVYNVAQPSIVNGQVKNAYAVDGFPEQLHKAATDHDDFIAVFKNNLANTIANCINSGKKCQ
ncbi:DUF1996 domain-containing protein [Streptomyces arenae]|uniref:DUF1996 domain-containing protein n=1 Tax=Streptomyces arenae TaxID=29301 RepID=UPI00265A3B36|nr:DUF1996 domain-containing protein [Streptomyces arenae]MCG7209410.1 DUF1996 domain-containing protein [Streptomyces arenae]